MHLVKIPKHILSYKYKGKETLPMSKRLRSHSKLIIKAQLHLVRHNQGKNIGNYKYISTKILWKYWISIDGYFYKNISKVKFKWPLIVKQLIFNAKLK